MFSSVFVNLNLLCYVTWAFFRTQLAVISLTSFLDADCRSWLAILLTFSSIFQTLPAVVQKRIKALKNIQLEITNVESEFFKEVHALECKYQSSYEPLFEKRATITKGDYEPTEEESTWTLDDDDEELSEEMKSKAILEGEKKDEESKGIPEFWLTIFKNVDLLADMMQEHDEPILKHLIDIKVQYKENPMGFILEFHFSPNEHFENSVLIKKYEMKCTPDEEDPFSFEGPEIHKCKVSFLLNSVQNINANILPSTGNRHWLEKRKEHHRENHQEEAEAQVKGLSPHCHQNSPERLILQLLQPTHR